MKTLFLNLGMGAAGDMLTAALYELLNEEEKKEFLEKINSIGIPETTVLAEKSVKCGITGTHITVKIGSEEEESEDVELSHHDHDHHHEHATHHDHDHDHDNDHHHDHDHDHDNEHHHDHDHDHNHEHHHSHNDMPSIEAVVNGLNVPSKVKADVVAVYKLIAEAESHVHGVPVEQIHFHEVGSMDAVCDVTAVCYLLHILGIEKVVATPVHVGSGNVRCAHGILPVPAPATAHILQGIPVYGGGVKGELCTPTGAALLKHFVSSFENMPTMTVERIGYGMGKKDFAVANCVVAMLGETASKKEEIIKLDCNLDDMTPERVSFAMERLFDAGALDVYTVHIGMKKSRQGLMLSVLCNEDDREAIVQTIFKYTTTLGIRENTMARYTLSRRVENISTSVGNVRIKLSSGYGIEREKYEYEDLAKIAREKDLSLEEVMRIVDNERA